jgi:hypothetical protein
VDTQTSARAKPGAKTASNTAAMRDADIIVFIFSELLKMRQ